MPSDFDNFILRRPIKPTDDTKQLSLGNPAYTPLKTFLNKDACDFHKCEIAKTYVLIDQESMPSRIWAFITLMNSEIDLSEADPTSQQRPQKPPRALRYSAFPSVKIARFAVIKIYKEKE